MTSNLALPVSAIEGIGPAVEGALIARGLFVVGDLLRVDAETIHDAVSPIASLDEARQWQDAAYLLQIRQMTPQWAEALVASGVRSLETLLERPLDLLSSVFASAAAAATIPQPPEVDDLFAIVKDAAQVRFSGVATVTVLGPLGGPIAGASVSVGNVTQTTDARGRCRLLRIAPATANALRVRCDGYAALDEQPYAVTYDDRCIGTSFRTLTPLAPGVNETVVRLDEFDGDSVPALSGARVVTETFLEEELRDGDVLRVTELLVREPTATLVSMFRAYEPGTLIVRRVRVPIARLGQLAAVGTYVRVRKGMLEATRGGIAALECYRAQRRARRLVSTLPLPADKESLIAWVRTYCAGLGPGSGPPSDGS